MAAAAPANPPPDGIDMRVEQAVLGIVSYTRWPQGPIRPRLCVLGEPAYAGALLAGPGPLDGGVTVSRDGPGDAGLAARCDAVYEGTLTPSLKQSVRQLLGGHPTLTIAENDPECSGGSMFCLDIAAARAGGQVLFSVNLDSVARGGVQINPRVLLLGRRRKAPS